MLKRGVYLCPYSQHGLDKAEHGHQRYVRQLGKQLSLGNIDYSELHDQVTEKLETKAFI